MNNREIKFRAWDRVNNKMLLPQSGYQIQVPHDDFFDADVYWMQYTGLKDKNGIEIYEGDILAVKFHPHYVERVSWNGKPDAIAEVFWDFTGLRIRAKGEKDQRYADFEDFIDARNFGYDIYDMNFEETEVIGNIYENPDLLNSDQNATEVK